MDEVSICIDSLRGGGAERVCATLCNEFVYNGLRVNLIVMDLSEAVYRNDLDEKVNVFNADKFHFRNMGPYLYKYVKTNKPRVILTFNYQIAIILNLLKYVFRLKYKVISRNINTLSKAKDSFNGVWHKHIVNYIVYKFYNRTDFIIAQSNGMRDDLIKNYRISPNKVIVINNPVNQKIGDIYNGVSDKKNNEILFIGRLTRQKRLDLLIEAMSIVRNINPDVKLNIIGKGELEEELISLVNERKLEDCVNFLGFRQDVSDLYDRSAITVLSSEYEGFPNVLVESITCATPIVAFDCPSGPREIISEENGYLVNYLDVNDLASKINLALNRQWDYDKVRQTSERFKSSNIANEYIKYILEGE